MPDLEERVAALEATAALFTCKLFERGDISINDARAAHGYPALHEADALMTEDQVAEFRRQFDEVMQEPFTHRILASLPPLTPEQVRCLLSECVTVVKPGEVMILRALEGWTPQQVLEVQQVAAMWLEDNAPGVKALVMPPFEIAIVPGGAAEPEFMSEVQADACWSTRGTRDVRLTHEPSGVIVEAATRTEAVAKLGRALEGYARRHAGGVPGAA